MASSYKLSCLANLPMLAILTASCHCAGSAEAATIRVSCEQEDVMVAGWTTPLSAVYEGDASGTLQVKSPHVDLTLPATRSEKTGPASGGYLRTTTITASGETEVIMPDVVALNACIEASLQPEFKGNSDMEAIAAISCLSTVPQSLAPVAISGAVRLGILVPESMGAPDVILEISRSYLADAPTSGPTIGNFPKNCVISDE